MTLARGDAATAELSFETALSSPAKLGEAKHLLTNQSDIHYFLGNAASMAGETAKAREHWERAASFKGDFQALRLIESTRRKRLIGS